MQEQTFIRITQPAVAALPAGKLSPFLQLAEARGPRKIRIALPAGPRRLEKRKILSARRVAEFAAWQASGGDFLRSSLAPGFSKAYQAGSN
jgi:hypothetical protein